MESTCLISLTQYNFINPTSRGSNAVTLTGCVQLIFTTLPLDYRYSPGITFDAMYLVHFLCDDIGR